MPGRIRMRPVRSCRRSRWRRRLPSRTWVNTTASSTAKPKPKRGPIFRATADQIKEAQAILKQRGFYEGEQTGKLDAATRAGLKKYQKPEGLKVTGTLNKATLEKMGIALTDRQKAM